MELTAAHGQSPAHHSSSPLPLSPADEPPADLTFIPPLENQELPDQESTESIKRGGGRAEAEAEEEEAEEEEEEEEDEEEEERRRRRRRRRRLNSALISYC
ncbi:uncharacterized protein LOC135213244 [Macrobrachium nipponense]|uniref:uncharacterized protein LOC135213244 n=1 Tax=Macrobrachium nipponense TaxID=159736 RepID=UPI0030C7C28B